MNKFKSIMIFAFLLMTMGRFDVYANDLKDYVTNTRVNFRISDTTEADIIATLEPGTTVKVAHYVKDDWSKIIHNEKEGYIRSEFLMTAEEYQAQPKQSPVELLSWKEIKSLVPLHVDMEIKDIYTGLTYHVRSFSNGNHADIETSTKADTDIMLKTYGGKWKWDPRPVFVTIGGRRFAASINGMPHGGGVISGNGMNGQVCLHFKGSTTHNGNRSFERDHQAAVDVAWNHR